MKIISLATVIVLNGITCVPAISGEVIDFKEGLIYMLNDGVPKRVLTDRKNAFVMHRPKSAYPKAGASFGTYSAGRISSELNDAAQNVFFDPAFKRNLQRSYYSGPDKVYAIYEHYINVPYQVEPK